MNSFPPYVPLDPRLQENIKKKDLRCFQGGAKPNIGKKGVKEKYVTGS